MRIADRLYLLLILTFFCTTAFAQSAPPPSKAITGAPEMKLDTLDNRPVMTVDSITVTRGEINRVILSLNQEQQEQAKSEEGRRAILNQIVRRKIMLLQARQEGLLQDPIVKAAMASAAENVLIQALVERISYKRINLTRDSIRAIYNANPKQFTLPERVHLSQIVVSSDTLARSLYRRLQKGEKFAELATQYSEGNGRDREGEVGWFSMNDLPKEMAEGIFKMKPNTFSEPTQSKQGWHIFLVHEHLQESLAPFDQVEQNLGQQVVEDRRNQLIDAYIQQILKDKQVTTNNKNLFD